MWNKLELQGLTILEKLENEGYEAFFVGGYVRDKCWGKPVKDIDIATSAKPEEVVRLFDKTIPTGLKHGTVTVMISGTAFEVTTFRKESDYADFRRPAEVEFISELEEDLRRRDFTMNAMAMDRRGAVRDPFGGQADMDRKLLRCVGDPLERFQEDALRMLRCIRFASAYGLQVDPPTWEAMIQRRNLLRHVAMERVRVELERTLEGPEPYRGWRLLLDSGLLEFTKEPLQWPYKSFDSIALPEHMAALDQLPQPIQRWMLILMESGLDGEATKDLLRQLTFSVKDLERIARTVDFHLWLYKQDMTQSAPLVDEIFQCSPSDRFKLAVLQFGRGAVQDWLDIRRAVADSGGSIRDQDRLLLDYGRRWMDEVPVWDMKDLAISGKDLIRSSGQRAGPWVGQAMYRCLRLAALGRVDNSEEALLRSALPVDR